MKNVKKTVLILFLTFSFFMRGQFLQKLGIECGPLICGLTSPYGFDLEGLRLGASLIIEPTIYTFGPKKQFDFNFRASFTQKGGQIVTKIVTEDQPEGLGIGAIPFKMNVVSFLPNIRTNFGKCMFFDLGPRIDILNSYEAGRGYSYLLESNINVVPVSYGISYSIGICLGKRRVKFVSAFIGQNNFTKSANNKVNGDKFKSYDYVISFGALVTFNDGSYK